MSTLDEFIREFVPHKPAFTLTEVSEITGFTRLTLADWCRSGGVEHQFGGRQRTMTRPQVIKLLHETHVEPSSAPGTAESVEVKRLADHRARVATRLAKRGVASNMSSRGATR